MATETLVKLTDDIDGSAADRTVTFGWEGSTYELDLSKKNATAFEKAVAPYLDASRKVSTRGKSATRSRAASSSAGDSKRRADIREWARGNGYEIGDRGRIPAELVDAYDARTV